MKPNSAPDLIQLAFNNYKSGEIGIKQLTEAIAAIAKDSVNSIDNEWGDIISELGKLYASFLRGSR